ncbi:MFS transporter [Rosenbergiella australiborealis]|uniref:Uncharacterized MFS-type transporter HGT73_06335 n=1 Tax=Rosenbergiella australiborealis TaxID=1544696 RepID=A0ABS5T6D4_9GAMM|nr:MFS transporter [Rosenbergiella australiborealis]MBT0727007.1 MFS transporter [Rosenbergiella australiborealis]
MLQQNQPTRGQLNQRILSVMIFTFFCYLSVGLPLAVLPGFVHQQLGYSPFISGLIISLQYFATLISRPQSGKLADLFGPKKVVMLGMVLCGLSGLMTILAALFASYPLVSLSLLIFGRIFLGVGESFSSTGATLWGMNLVGSVHTARVISWNGVATYFAMAVGAPFGVMLNQWLGISGFAGLVLVMGISGFIFARSKADISITLTAPRLPFRQVLGLVTPYGLGLALGTLGFGVIATFITLYFSSRGWQGAALTLSLYSLGFVLSRFLFSNMITRFGGLMVSLGCLLTEAIGLFFLWHAESVFWADIGAFLTGAGFSLVFPALGVEAVRKVSEQSKGSALGTYSAFLDLALGLTGPVAGLLMNHTGIRTIYLAAAMMVCLGAVLVTYLLLSNHRRVTSTE